MTPLTHAFIQDQIDKLDEINAGLAIFSDELANPVQRATLRKAINKNLKVSRHLKALLYDSTEELLDA